MRLVERIWDGGGKGEMLGRAVLFPFETLYRGVVAARGELYDRGVLETRPSAVPVISVGNLTVGGTGKTPVASWLAVKLTAMGARPAIVLRGYGEDEILVHRRLTPGVPVISSKERSAGILRAAAAGSNVVVLDDGFQHRQTSRDADIVIVSADRWNGRTRLLPAGPWREPFASIGRASLAVISRKAATNDQVDEVARAITRVAPAIAQTVVALSMSGLTRVGSEMTVVAMSALNGKRLLAVSAVGDPASFACQLSLCGAVVASLAFPDHHDFSRADVDDIITRAGVVEMIVCTLKDAVKLESLWPVGAPSLWYVSQSLEVESGGAAIDELLNRFRPAN